MVELQKKRKKKKIKGRYSTEKDGKGLERKEQSRNSRGE